MVDVNIQFSPVADVNLQEYLTKEYIHTGVGAIFRQECQKRGMLVRVAGDIIMMSPPLTMTPGEVDELVSIYGEALKSTEEKVAALKSKKD